MGYKDLQTMPLTGAALLVVISLSAFAPVLAEPVVIGHPELQPIDRQTLARIYTGRVAEYNGVHLTPVNLPPGNPVRVDFLRAYLDQNDDKYIGYWIVRRYVGKGTPPRELTNASAVIEFVSQHSGAIGYIDDTRGQGDLNIIFPSP